MGGPSGRNRATGRTNYDFFATSSAGWNRATGRTNQIILNQFCHQLCRLEPCHREALVRSRTGVYIRGRARSGFWAAPARRVGGSAALLKAAFGRARIAPLLESPAEPRAL